MTVVAFSPQLGDWLLGLLQMPDVKIVIGDKNTSSWSLRAWLVLAVTGLPFDEIKVKLRRPDSRERLLELSPTGKVPALIVEGETIWDSLAISEFLGEVQPSLWPGDERQRAVARSISAEMHSGFADLRLFMPMDFLARYDPPGRMLTGVAADVKRISRIWLDCLNLHAPGGPFLFGTFSIADAMYAPVVSRFITYAVPVEPQLRAYMDAIMAMPEMQAWGKGARAELDAAERERPGPEPQPAPPSPIVHDRRSPSPGVNTQPNVPRRTVPDRKADRGASPPMAPSLADRREEREKGSEFRARTLGMFRAQVDLDEPARSPDRSGGRLNRRRPPQSSPSGERLSDRDTFFFGIDDDQAAQPTAPQTASVSIEASREGQKESAPSSAASRLFKRKVSLEEVETTLTSPPAPSPTPSRSGYPADPPLPEELLDDDDIMPPVSRQPSPRTSESALPDVSESGEEHQQNSPRRSAIKPIGGEIHRRR